MKKILLCIFFCILTLNISSCHKNDKPIDEDLIQDYYSFNTIAPNEIEINNILKKDSDNNVILPSKIDNLKVISLNFKSKNFMFINKLYIPETIKYINLDNFFGTINEISVSELNEFYDSRNSSNTLNEILSDTNIYIAKKGEIPAGIKIIGENVLNKCKPKNLFIPASVIRIQESNSILHDTERIVVHEDNLYFDSRGNCNSIIEKSTNKMFLTCPNSFIPNGVKVLISNLFDTKYIKKIFIPASVNSIADDFIINYQELEEIIVEQNNSFYDSRDNCNCLIEKSTNTLLLTSKNSFIPDGVEIISSKAFYKSNIGKIHIPSTVSYIDKQAFSFCSNLEKISVDKNNQTFYSPWRSNAIITRSGNVLVKGCNNTKIPNETEEIAPLAFMCSNIHHIYIPASLKKLYYDSFYNCKELEEIEVDSNNTVYDSRNNCNGVVEKNTNKLILGANTVSIDETIEIIGQYSICNLKSNNLVLPYGLRKIEMYGISFSPNSSELYNLFIPSTLTIIDSFGIRVEGNLSVYINTIKRPEKWSKYSFIGSIKEYYKNEWPSNIANPYI